MPFTIHRGTNISHWLSQSDARGEDRRRRFTRDDVKRLADLGVDHLRLPVDEEQLFDEANRREPEAWDLLNSGLDWCREAGLRAIVDLHILRSHHFNAVPEGKTLFTDPRAADRFGEVWRELSSELRSRSTDQVAYELLNEAVADDPDDWNRVLRVPYQVVREAEPERIIAIGSNRWCQASTFGDLDVPEADPNIILVFHYYNPMPITHCRASWVEGLRDYEGPIQYPGPPIPEAALDALDADLRSHLQPQNRPFDRTVIERDIAPTLRVSQQTGLPLWCNEFGAIAHAPYEIRKAWYADLLAVLERHGIAWTNWDLRGGFGLFEKDNRPTAACEALFGAGGSWQSALERQLHSMGSAARGSRQPLPRPPRTSPPRTHHPRCPA